MSKERPEGRLCFLLKQVLPFFFGQLLWFENHDELLEGAREGKRHFVHVVLYHRSSGVPTFLTSLPEFPFQQGSSLNTANINYNSIQAMEAMKRLQQLESFTSPHD